MKRFIYSDKPISKKEKKNNFLIPTKNISRMCQNTRQDNTIQKRYHLYTYEFIMNIMKHRDNGWMTMMI